MIKNKDCDSCKYGLVQIATHCQTCEDGSLFVGIEENEPDMISHPPHYEREGAMECIDEIELVFGKEVAMHFCLGNVWKYRYRSGMKGEAMNDIKKSDWYLRKYSELKEASEKGTATVKIPRTSTSWVDTLLNGAVK